MQSSPFVTPLLLALSLAPSATNCFAQAPDTSRAESATVRLGELLERDWPDRPDWADMAIAILKGNLREGWWKEAETRYEWAWLAETLDVDSSSAIERGEFLDSPNPDAFFARLDRDGSGAITADDLDWSDGSAYVQQLNSTRGLFSRLDADLDGRLTPQDLARFVGDADPDDVGFLTNEDLLAELQRPRDPAGGEEMPRSEAMLAMLLNGELGSLHPGPALEEEAPPFTLSLHDGSGEVTLSDSRGKRPVVLLFGSCTCGPYRSRSGFLDKLHARYRDHADFYVVYIREAHPEDGWRMSANAAAGIEIFQPKTFEARREAAALFCSTSKTTVPVLVDGLDNEVGEAYSGFPDRLYLVDPAGRVAYKGGRGPFGYKPGELEQALVMCLIDETFRQSPAESETEEAASEDKEPAVTAQPPPEATDP
jgi:hypothetical protein